MTTTSLTLLALAAANSTSFWRSGVTVMLPAAMSPLPAAKEGSRRSPGTGMNTTRTFRFLFLSLPSAASFLLRSSSNTLKASATMPRLTPLSTKKKVLLLVVSTRIVRRSIMPSRSPVQDLAARLLISIVRVEAAGLAGVGFCAKRCLRAAG